MSKIVETPDFYACELSDTKELYSFLGITKEERLTVSAFGSATGHSIWETPIDCADNILGHAPQKAEKLMGQSRRGIQREPLAIKVYEKITGNKALPVFYAMPKWNKRLGGITDGMVAPDGMVEVKCPDKIWKSVEVYMDYMNMNPVTKSEEPIDDIADNSDEILAQCNSLESAGVIVKEEKVEKKEVAWVQTKNCDILPPEFSHIPHYYYDQMQGYMAIFKRKWCDFFVFCEPQNKYFLQRVPFNLLYWEDLHDKINHFLNVILPERKRYHDQRLRSLAEPKKIVTIPNF